MVKFFIISLIILMLLFLATLYAFPSLFVGSVSRLFPKILFRVNTDKKVVAISIDDSPAKGVTPAILEVLKKYDTKATFFIIGNNALSNEKLIDDILAEGHELGNHMMESGLSLLCDEKEFRDQISKLEQIIPIKGNPKLFRPGGGLISSKQLRILDDLGYRCCLGSLYFWDAEVKSAGLISTLTMLNLRPGMIIILHDGKSDRIRTVKILENILPLIISKGYKVVTISELIKYQ